MNSIKSYCFYKNNKFNYLGIEILRMALSFLIVVVHCNNIKNIKNIKFLKFVFLNLKFYVPTFFIISFYFSYNTFASKNINKIKQRFIRILMPYILWPIIFWIRYIIYNFYINKKDKEIFINLYYQLLIGHGFYGVFWYLFNLIFISVFFIIIIIIFKKKILFLMIVLYILIYIYNYLGYNEYIFSKFNHKIEHSIKPLSSSLFYSISGFLLGSIRILNKLKKYRIFIIILLSILISIIKDSIKVVKYFPHIFRINLVSLSLFIIFGIISFDKIKINIIICFISHITKYTGGIYYLHPEARDLLVKYFNLLKKRSLKECLEIYLICYFICFLGSILFRKSIFKYLLF